MVTKITARIVLFLHKIGFKNFKNFIVYKTASVYDYCQKQNTVIKTYDNSLQYPSRILSDFDHFESSEKDFAMRPSYYIYLSLVKNATIFGCQDFILADTYCLNDAFFSNVRVNTFIDKRFTNICAITNKDVIVHKSVDTNTIIDKGIYLVKMWSDNNFHFAFDALARLSLLENLKEYDSFPSLIDKVAVDNPWNQELLEIINQNKHPIILIEPGKKYTVNELLYPSNLHWGTGQEIKAGYAPCIHKKAARYLIENIKASHSITKEYDKVYIARGDNKRLLNEYEISDYLQMQGFDIINPNKASYKDFLDVFMTANIIIGVTGTGMVNMMLTKKSAIIYIICPFEFQHDEMIAIGDASEVNFTFIAADIKTKNKILKKSSFYLPLNRIKAVIQ
ncbi:MAG: glycosyltransferase family 61 protein [Lachnospiraceae bacterium]|nr:glycosyltransferase family 61 protein [Lachnospiraceae bacterium]